MFHAAGARRLASQLVDAVAASRPARRADGGFSGRAARMIDSTCAMPPPPEPGAMARSLFDAKGESMAAEHIATFTDTNFEASVINADKPVLVDFWAEWCGPCRMLAPTVDALASELNGRLVVGKLNVDDNPMTTTRYNVRGIPTLLLFKGGAIVESVVGVQDKNSLKRLIEQHV
jgi:thioredoxin 1